MGFVYIMTNEAMPGLVKIGSTSRTVEERESELSNTSVPFSFQVYCSFPTDTPCADEAAVFAALAVHRIRASREFFQLRPEAAALLIKAALSAPSSAPSISSAEIIDPLSVGRWVRATRKNVLNITQAELATKAGTGVRFIHDLEAGAVLHLDKILDVVRALGGELSLQPKKTTREFEKNDWVWCVGSPSQNILPQFGRVQGYRMSGDLSVLLFDGRAASLSPSLFQHTN